MSSPTPALPKKGGSVLHYHIPTDTLKDAVCLAYDLYLSAGIKPDSIDYGDCAYRFHERDALQLKMGDLNSETYAKRHAE